LNRAVNTGEEESNMKTIYGVQSLTLPSGNKVRVRRPSVLSLIAAGGFPTDLTSEAWKLARKDMIDPDKMAADPEGVKSWAKLIDAFIPHVLADLQITGSGETKIEEADGYMTGVMMSYDMNDMDKQVVFLFGTGVLPSDEEMKAKAREEISAEALKEFRDERESVDAGHGGEAVRAEAVVDGGDQATVVAGA
jgi:hypothetical protein